MDQNIKDRFEFRSIRREEADKAADIEQICFPPNEACKREHIRRRVEAASGLFLVAVCRKTGEIAGFLNGIATSEPAFRDEFFTDISLHRSSGENVMLLGLDVLPEFRRQGLAGAIVKEYSKREKEKGRKRLILTCLDDKVAMYEKFGFQDNGQANSNWGGELWHEMSMEL